MGHIIIEGLNKLEGDWEHIKRIVPYGAGLEAYRTLKRVIQDFEVPFIVDQDEKKPGRLIYGVEVHGLEELRDLKEDTKVVITVAKRRYSEIKETLESYGLVENKDFCHISQFGMEWYYKYRHECCIFTMDIAVTTCCTLKCKKCNMFIPYYDKPVMYTCEEIKHSVDLLFQHVDYVFALGILGGEALLNPNLIPIIEYLDETYGNRIGSILVTTNGLTIPSKKILEVFKTHNVIVTISDYRNSIHEKSRLEEIRDILQKENILFTIRESLVWCDFGFPNKPFDIEESACRKHMLNCDPGWRGLNDGKFYFCNVAWSAEKAGLVELNGDDYIDLLKLGTSQFDAKTEIMEYTTGNLKRGYMSFCKMCGGCGEDNKSFVTAGEQ